MSTHNKIGRRLIFLIIAFSSIITLFITVTQLFFDYREQRANMNSTLENIKIHVPTITNSVWAFDDEQIELAIEALSRLPDVTQVSIVTHDKSKQWKTGQSHSSHVVTKVYPLLQARAGTKVEIGNLEVVASLDAIYRRLYEHVLSTLLSNGVKTFLVAAFMVLLFRRIVTNRLEKLMRNADDLATQLLPEVEKKYNESHALPKHLDELDAVQWAFDSMAKKLRAAIDDLRVTNLSLQQENAERRQAQDALVQSSQEIEDLYSNAPCGYHSLDKYGMFVRINQTELNWLGYAREDVIEKMKFTDIMTADSQRIFKENFQKLLQTGNAQDIEYELICKDGSILPVLLNASSVYDKDGQYIMSRATLFNITERKRHEIELEYQATHDALTGLPNRTSLNARIALAIARARRNANISAVIFFDLDNFKYVNDSLGHDVGDDLLQKVAARLKVQLREVDTVARYGGDEFVVVLSDIQREESVIRFAEKIVDSMRQSFVICGKEQFVTTSLGISLFPQDGQDTQTLLRNADMAMYRAKENGRNNFQFFSLDMNVNVSQRLTLENELRHALDRNQLMLHYQPQADSHSGEIIGMEALLRWQHPELGMISPLKFIGLAEETGLIVAIGEWVLREACRQNKAWQTLGLIKVKIAVNLSGRQFRQTDLVDMVKRALDETGLEPQYLELELTESIIMHDPERVIEILDQLSALGISLALDDFGTGYSSLSYLKRFPINKIKIDKSFVDHITTDPDDAAIANAIISIAHEMKMTVIAEGTETEEQILFLRAQQCHAVQGYFFCKPINAVDLESFLRSGARLSVGVKSLPAV